jgi:hypothetical protein
VPIGARHHKQGFELLLRIATLDKGHPLSKLPSNDCIWYRSPLVRLRDEMELPEKLGVEKIEPQVVAPWQRRMRTHIFSREQIDQQVRLQANEVIAITAVASRKRKIAYAYRLQVENCKLGEATVVLGTRSTTNPYIAELTAIRAALQGIYIKTPTIKIISANESTLKAIRKPGQQSGQKIIEDIHLLEESLRRRKTQVTLVWIPAVSASTPPRKEVTKLAKTATISSSETLHMGPIPISTFRNTYRRKILRAAILVG